MSLDCKRVTSHTYLISQLYPIAMQSWQNVASQNLLCIVSHVKTSYAIISKVLKILPRSACIWIVL